MLIRAEQVTDLVEQAVLGVFAQISLDPAKRHSRSKESKARAGLAAELESGRARLARLDDDHWGPGWPVS